MAQKFGKDQVVNRASAIQDCTTETAGVGSLRRLRSVANASSNKGTILRQFRGPFFPLPAPALSPRQWEAETWRSPSCCAARASSERGPAWEASPSRRCGFLQTERAIRGITPLRPCSLPPPFSPLPPLPTPPLAVSRSSECGAAARDAASAPAAAPQAREETQPPPAPTRWASRGSHRRLGRRRRRGAKGRRRENGRGRRGFEGDWERRRGTDGRTDGPTDCPGRGPPSSLPGPSAPARGGRGGGGGAGEGRGRRYRDNNPAARLWGRRRGGAGGLARPRLAQRPGGILVPAGRVPPPPSGVRGAPGARSSRLSADSPLPSPSPARAELVFRVPLDRAGSCFCAKAGSEFRTVIPGGVTSEKFFFRRRS
ncbi:translation initiation factor IF-2-like [Mustela erminea]|uniref:translation initiation factor IF-2-like n=1 Tax=Mustela erminea TaxID=36723 RepID=UPI0013868CC7|nr:translation initiation factor IF-2-like [Mustela erminea]